MDTVGEFTVVWARRQTAGIGQRGNCWTSEEDANLTFSLILKPSFLNASEAFRITQVVAIGISDMLQSLLPSDDIRIKWPNDIWVGGRKICGTLIASKIQGTHLASAICGIGLNVNQTVFPDWVPNPTSLHLVRGKRYVLRPLLDTLLQCIRHRYRQLHDEGWVSLEQTYLEQLLHYRQPAHYRYQDHIIEATIEGVDAFGQLLLTTREGESLRCQMKEIALLP